MLVLQASGVKGDGGEVDDCCVDAAAAADDDDDDNDVAL